jgi:hypothetical protein
VVEVSDQTLGHVPEMFYFGEMNIPHDRLADPEVIGTCDMCWSSYPRRCKCGGWVHANFMEDLEAPPEAPPDAPPIGSVLEFGCDRCGKEYETTDR